MLVRPKITNKWHILCFVIENDTYFRNNIDQLFLANQRHHVCEVQCVR